MLKDLDVVTKPEMKLEAITASGAVVRDNNSNQIELPCDTIVLSLGMEPRTEIAKIFGNLVPETYIVGDCNNQRGSLLKAVSEGFFAAMEI
jgi:thioredoxin reductase